MSYYKQLDVNGFSRVPVDEISEGFGRSPELDPNTGWNPPAGQAGKDNDYMRRKNGTWLPPVTVGGPYLLGGFSSPIPLLNKKTALRNSLYSNNSIVDFYKP